MSCGGQEPREREVQGVCVVCVCVCVCVCVYSGHLQTDEGASEQGLYLAGSPKGRPEPGFREGARGHILTRGDRKPAWCLSGSRQADCTDLLSS